MSDPTDWAVTALLCDSAQVADGKLYVLGGGWSLSGPGAFVHALAMKIGVPWNEANRRHQIRAVLRDEDSRSVELGDPPQELAFESEFEVGRPAGLPPATLLDLPLAINFGPIELPANRGYAWVIEIDGDEVDRVLFRTRLSQ